MSQEWFKIKKYLHFDIPLQETQKEDIEKLIKNPDWVVSHSFYPFINYQATKYKVKKDPQTKKRYLDDKKTRPIAYAAHLDAAILGYYSSILSLKYENAIYKNNLSDTVIAFRKLFDSIEQEPKSNIHLARDAFSKIQSLQKCKAYAFDITKFFDSLDRNQLKKAWMDILETKTLPKDHYKIFKIVSEHTFVDKEKLYQEFGLKKSTSLKDQLRICSPSEFRNRVRKKGLIQKGNFGVPQGSPISAILANIYMLEFDKKVNSKFRNLGGAYFRYCDDILCLVPAERDFDVESFIKSEISSIGLSINSDKTDISDFDCTKKVKCDKPIKYLGFVFDGDNTYIRTSSISKYVRKAKAAVDLAKKSMAKINSERMKKGLPPVELYKKTIFQKYYHTGKTNFIRYGIRSAKIMKSNSIRRQIKKLNKLIETLVK